MGIFNKMKNISDYTKPSKHKQHYAQVKAIVCNLCPKMGLHSEILYCNQSMKS